MPEGLCHVPGTARVSVPRPPRLQDFRRRPDAVQRAQARGSDGRKLPGIPALAVEPAVGLGIVHELPPGWIPVERAAVPVGQVDEDGDRHRAGADHHRAGADRHVGQRALAGADAVEPVAMVARGLLKVDVLRARGSLTMATGSLLRWSRSIRSVPSVPVKVQPLGPPQGPLWLRLRCGSYLRDVNLFLVSRPRVKLPRLDRPPLL
jgi:hypothetical protein